MILIKNGQIFDGSKSASYMGSVLVQDGKVEQIIPEGSPLPEIFGDADVIDAKGCWITPGFIDTHTHYDFEVLVNPALGESVRHGVTTVIAGSCSITAIMAKEEDCSDIFTRVEGVPREHVLPALKEKKKWSRPKEYIEYLKTRPLGANVCQYIGHSDLRIAAMGIDRATTENSVPTPEEQKFMEDALQEAIDAGFMGMSTMQSFLDKLDGDRVRSRGLPSIYADFKEYAFLHKVLRDSNRILQTSPDINNANESMGFLIKEMTGVFRPALRMTSLALIDTKATRGSPFARAQAILIFIMNNIFRANFRWQMLPCEFTVRVRGLDFVIFEEVPSGEAYLHLSEKADREKLVTDPKFREQFKKDVKASFQVGTWNRDIGDGIVWQCEDKSLLGKRFVDIASETNRHVADVFIDLLIKYGEKLIWTLVLGNEQDKGIVGMFEDKMGTTQVSFSDAGAHINNMSFYNFPLQMLARLRGMRKSGLTKMTDEQCIHRLTGELADWYRIDAGHIKVGARADINVIDPTNIEKSLNSVEEKPFAGIDGLTRFVNRNEGIVKHVLINGKVAFTNDKLHEDLGRSLEYGNFLKAM